MLPSTILPPEVSLPQEIAERTNWTFSLTMYKPDGAGGVIPIPLAEITSLVLTVHDLETDAVIGTLADVDIRNTGRGVVDATSGRLTVTLAAADNPIITTTRQKERHRALVELTGPGGLEWAQGVTFTITNMNKRP